MKTQAKKRSSVKREFTNLKREILKAHYNKQYSDWNGKFTDDRQVFCNIYEILLEVLDAMDKVENIFVWTAFNEKYHKEEQTLANIAQRFCE